MTDAGEQPLRKALFGFHNLEEELNMCHTMAKKAKRNGFEVTMVSSVESMREALRASVFDLIAMDINLGYSNVPDPRPAQEIFDYARPYIESGRTRYVALSANPSVVQAGRNAGLPCEEKTSIAAINAYLK